MKRPLAIVFLLLVFRPIWAEVLHSPSWGFRLDLPEGYEYSDGDGRDRFSFTGPSGILFDMAVYSGTHKDMRALVDDVNAHLKNAGETTFFEYGEKIAALMELEFDGLRGWGLCVELAEKNGTVPLLLALSYAGAEAETPDLSLFHLSALDSIVPSRTEEHIPGPIMEFAYPRGEAAQIRLAGTEIDARIHENDAEAAQALVDREFALLRHYLVLDNWQEAWIRFYRAIYRDSWDRLADAVFKLERSWRIPVLAEGAAKTPAEDFGLNLARKALTWVQGFTYERDLQGSDFVNLVTAAAEGRGDCDSRAMLFALILAQANVPAAMMVSREHSHAMGLADINGTGARFETGGKKWLVAETTASVDIGLIAQNVSDIESWLGVTFE